MDNEVRAAALTVLFAATGCSGGGEMSRSTGSAGHEAATVKAESPVAAGPDVRVPLLPAGGTGPQVGAIGVSRWTVRACTLRAPNGSRTLPIFATARTRWNRSAGVLEVGDKSFRSGQTVTLGGSPADSLPSGLDWVQAPDSRCKAPWVFIARSIETGG